MASKKFSLIDIQDDDQEIDLQFQDFGNVSTAPKPGTNADTNEHTIYFSNFPDSHEDDQERKKHNVVVQKRKKEDMNVSDLKKFKDTELSMENFFIQPILSDEFCSVPQFVNLVVLQISDRKLVSTAVQVLSKKIPAPTLLHLKRVKRVEILEKEQKFFIYLNTLEELKLVFTIPDDFQGGTQFLSLPDHVVSTVFKLLDSNNIDATIFCESVYLAKACKFAPKLKRVYDEVNKHWPCTFHEDLNLKLLLSGNYFCESEKKNIYKFMKLAFTLSQKNDKNNGLNRATVIAKGNTFNKSLKWTGTDKRFDNPLLHSCIIAIDVVAVAQGGGALQKDLIKSEIKKFKDICQYEYDVAIDSSDSTCCSNEANDYLCTEFTAYMTDEPCPMCAMALLHSRIKRIFFLRPNLKRGAIGSVIKLHTLPKINHRYDVFKVCLNMD